MSATSTREMLRHRSRVRQAAMTLDPASAVKLWPSNWGAVCLPQYHYDTLAQLCLCKTRQHRRKDCNLDRLRGCRSCGAMYEYDGQYPELCPGCFEWSEARIQYLGEWALAHDDRDGRQVEHSQLSLFDSHSYDWTGVPVPHWPFIWSRPKPTYVGEHGECRLCNNSDHAPTSFEASTAADPRHIREPVCTPCIRLANTNKRFDEGPTESIEQMAEIIAGRNVRGCNISHLREPWQPVRTPPTPPQRRTQEAMAQ